MRSDVQIIFQDPYSSLNPRMTVEDTIKEPLLISGKCDKQNVDAETERLMDMVGIARRIKMSYPHELDGGRRQRVGIARALALDPKFIVCDEPVSALDVSIQAQILNLLMDLQEEHGLAYMFITHNMSVVRHISHNISVMYLGQLVETSPTKELFAEPLHPYTKALLSAIPTTDILHPKERIVLKGDVPSPMNPPSGCHFHGRRRAAGLQIAAFMRQKTAESHRNLRRSNRDILYPAAEYVRSILFKSCELDKQGGHHGKISELSFQSA